MTRSKSVARVNRARVAIVAINGSMLTHTSVARVNGTGQSVVTQRIGRRVCARAIVVARVNGTLEAVVTVGVVVVAAEPDCHAVQHDARLA